MSIAAMDRAFYTDVMKTMDPETFQRQPFFFPSQKSYTSWFYIVNILGHWILRVCFRIAAGKGPGVPPGIYSEKCSLQRCHVVNVLGQWLWEFRETPPWFTGSKGLWPYIGTHTHTKHSYTHTQGQAMTFLREEIYHMIWSRVHQKMRRTPPRARNGLKAAARPCPIHVRGDCE